MKIKFKLIAVAMALIAAIASPLAAQDLTLKLGHLANEQNSWHKAYQWAHYRGGISQ